MNKINFQNLPSTATPLNAENLNQLQTNVENAIAEVITNGDFLGNQYTKYADGTLIQHGKVEILANTPRSAGRLTYWSGEQELVLPYSFVDSNYSIITNVELANMNIFCNSYGNIISTRHIKIALTSTTQGDGRYVDFVCIGRWK